MGGVSESPHDQCAEPYDHLPCPHGPLCRSVFRDLVSGHCSFIFHPVLPCLKFHVRGIVWPLNLPPFSRLKVLSFVPSSQNQKFLLLHCMAVLQVFLSQLKDTQVIKALKTFVCRFLCEHSFSFHQDKPRDGLLVRIFSAIFKQLPDRSRVCSQPFVLLPAVYERCSSSASSALGIVNFVLF